jgi:predicted enzyme related to lactoylglutathione lyase
VPKGTPAGAPPYTVFKLQPDDAMGVGGMMQAMQPGTPSHWVPYVVVENADASLAKAASLGARILLPVMAVGEVGRVAVIQDPQGATLGLHEPAK